MTIDTQLASHVVELCLRRGASAAEVIAREETEFSVSVRLGAIDTLTEADSSALGLRVVVDGRQSSVSTSDYRESSLDALVDEALTLARVTSVDESADLPDASMMATELPDLELFDTAIAGLSTDERIDMALRAESAARDVGPRITNFDRGGFGTTVGRTVFANSLGFAGSYDSTLISLSAIPVATDGEHMQRDYWYDMRRSLAEMETPESIGQKAALRTLRRLGARKVETCDVPVVFEPTIARDLLGTIFSACSGESVYRKASLYADSLGEIVASSILSVIDDGRVAKGIGSRPFDGEGLPTRRTAVIRDGVLENFLLNTYTGRKLGKPSTGNASRGIVGQASVGSGNLFIEPGVQGPDEIIRSVKRGFLVTELMGFGVNIVNGDYSRGAAGLWIEDGEIAYPIEEVTIAGNLKDMLAGIEMIGNDLEFRGRMAAPTIRIAKMTVSGR